MTDSISTIAILGGTGALGTGLAKRWSDSGYTVIVGSRTQEKAATAIENLLAANPDITVQAMENKAAADAADLVVLTVPYAHQISTLEYVQAELAGKILIDVTVPLMPPKVGTVQLPEGGSASAAAQAFLGDEVRVVSAFQNVAADLLQREVDIECDVLVAGNNKAARQTVIDLVSKASMTGWHAGPIANSAASEALTSIMIQLNRQFKGSHAGIKITGIVDS